MTRKIDWPDHENNHGQDALGIFAAEELNELRDAVNENADETDANTEHRNTDHAPADAPSGMQYAQDQSAQNSAINLNTGHRASAHADPNLPTKEQYDTRQGDLDTAIGSKVDKSAYNENKTATDQAIVDRIPKRGYGLTFAALLAGNWATFDEVESVCHHSHKYGGGSIYYMDGTSGAASTGYAGKFYDSTGTGWKRRPVDITLEAFGYGQNGNDATVSLQAAVDYAEAVMLEYSANNAAAQVLIYPTVNIELPSESIFITESIVISSNGSITFKSRNQTYISGTHNDFLFDVTGAAYRLSFESICFECTDVGAIRIASTNVSSAKNTIKKCRFVPKTTSTSPTCVAIDYDNRSAQLVITETYFNRVRTPLHVRQGDSTVFRDCWFGFSPYAVYPSKDGYIRNDAGHMTVTECIFAGGPSLAITAGSMANGSEIAYFNVGTEAPSTAAEDHARLTIENTRIGYESGAGVLVNYFKPYVTDNAGAGWRSGITLRNIQTEPREDKGTVFDGQPSAALVRLFSMPNQLELDEIKSTNGLLAAVIPGSTTTLDALLAQLDDDFEDIDFYSRKSKKRTNSFHADICAPSAYIVADETAPTMEENNRWLDLFGAFDCWFDSNNTTVGSSAGNETTVNIDTHYSVSNGVNIYQISAIVWPTVASTNLKSQTVHGVITFVRDRYANTLTARYQSADASDDVAITALFNVSGVEQSSITPGTAATLRINVQHPTNPGVAACRCAGAYITPSVADSKRGFIQA